MGKYLITGGAGFIGSHLAERLLRDGHRVTVLDDLSTGRLENLSGAMESGRLEFIEGSVADEATVGHLIERADGVFHLAATVGVLKIMQRPVETIGNNICGTQNVLAAATRRKTRVLITSTSEVYGKTGDVPFTENGNLVLGQSSQIRWGYAASKIVDEFLALGYAQQFGLPTVVVRPFNTIGPRQIGTYGMVVPRLLEQAMRNEDLTVYGDGRQTRCFTFVSDTVEWLFRLMTNDAALGEVFNLGNPHEVSISKLAEKIIAITGSRSAIRFIPYETAYQSGFEDMTRRLPAIEKVVAVTGHAPAVGLEEALDRTHQWMRAGNCPNCFAAQAGSAIPIEVQS